MKKILFGAIISAFLLLSMSFLTPVQVRAYEMQSAEEIKSKAEEITQIMENDNNILELIELHDNEDIRNIFIDVINAESDSEIDELVDDYLEEIDKDQLKELDAKLDQDYGEDYNSIKTSMNNLFDDEEKTSGNYRVRYLDGKIRVKKLDEVKTKENSLVFTEEGDIVFPNGWTLTKSMLRNLADFFCRLMQIFGILEFSGAWIMFIGAMLLPHLGLNLGGLIIEFGAYWGMFWGMLAIGSGVLCMFFNAIAEPEGESKTIQNKKVFLLEELRISIINLIKRVLQGLTC